MKEMENIQARFFKNFFSLCLEAGMGTDFRACELRGMKKKEGRQQVWSSTGRGRM